LPGDVDRSTESETESNSGETEVTFMVLLTNHPIFTMSALTGTTVQFFYSYMEPIMAKRLEEMNLD